MGTIIGISAANLALSLSILIYIVKLSFYYGKLTQKVDDIENKGCSLRRNGNGSSLACAKDGR